VTRGCFAVITALLLAAGLALAGPAVPWAAAADKARDKAGNAPAGSIAPHGKAAGKPQAKATGKPQEKAPKKVQVTDVQVYSGQDYSRIVVVLSGEARHRWQILPPDPGDGGTRRLYVDLEDVVIRPGVPSRFDVKGDVARKVRMSYFKPDTARMVVEVENLRSQNVFVLQNPYRVIVDVQGEAAPKHAVRSPERKSARPDEDKPAKAAKSSGKPAGKTGESLRDAGKPGLPGVSLDSPGKRRMARQLVEQLGLTVRTVMVDAGHGGRDSGARGAGGLWEKNVNLKVAKLLGARLEKMGFEVLHTRTSDKYVPLEVRTAMANARKADLFVSIHCNAHGDPGSSGMETYSLNLASTPDEVRVAARENAVDARRISEMQKILDELMHASKLSESREFAKVAHQSALSQARKSLNLRDRGVHEAPFYVLLGAKMPAILVEIGYITNPAEAARMKDEKYLDGLARGIADGVRAYKERIERYARN